MLLLFYVRAGWMDCGRGGPWWVEFGLYKIRNEMRGMGWDGLVSPEHAGLVPREIGRNGIVRQQRALSGLVHEGSAISGVEGTWQRGGLRPRYTKHVAGLAQKTQVG